jgi:hypothetical protein
MSGSVGWNVALLFLLGSGCGTSSTPATTDADVGATEATHDPQKNCVKPGTVGNELGVGGYCNPTDGPSCPSGAELRICTGALPAVPLDAWFCTKPCREHSECGTGALCLTNELGTGCVPLSCAGDAGAP